MRKCITFSQYHKEHERGLEYKASISTQETRKQHKLEYFSGCKDFWSLRQCCYFPQYFLPKSLVHVLYIITFLYAKC